MSGITTRQQIQQYITALADVYTTHWTHHPSAAGANFTRILARAPALHQFDIQDRAGDGDFLGPLTSEHAGGWIASLSAGYDDPNPIDGLAGGNPHDPMHHDGFTARISETLLRRAREEGEPRPVWEHVYPMRNVPVPAVDPAVEQGGRWMEELQGEMMLMQYQRRLRAPQRMTEEVAARLRVAGYEVPPVEARAPAGVGLGGRGAVGAVAAGVVAPGEATEDAAVPPGGEA